MRLEEEITADQLPNEPVQVYVRRCRNLWNLMRKAHGQWTFEYVAINYLIPGLHPAYDHIVDATISAANVTKRLATIISAGQNMEARTRQRQQRARSRTPTLNSCDPKDQLHATKPNIVCSSGVPVMLTCTTTAPGEAATGAQEGEGEDDEDDEFHESWHDHRSRAFASVIGFTRFYLSSQPTPVRYTVQDFPDALALPEVLSSFGACNIVRAASCGSAVHRDTLLWTTITQPRDIRSCGNNVAAIKLADPGPFSGCRIYNPATGRKTPPLSMPAFQFSNAADLMDAFQPSGQQEGPHAPPTMLPSAALASAQEGPPPSHHNEQHPPHHQEGDATALSAPHTSKHAQLTSHYVDLSDYHPTLVASAIAAVVRPRSARLTALALPAPTVRVSTAPRNYQEDIPSTHPDDWKKSMNHEINSISTMALFVWVNVPELRRGNESEVIQQTAWAFAAQHEDGNIIKREAGVIVRGNLLNTGETYAYDYLPPGCGRKDRAWHPVEALYDLPQASKAWFMCFSSFLHDFGFIGSEPGGVIHLHRETCINDILTTSHVTESKPRRLPCTPNTNFHNPAVTYRGTPWLVCWMWGSFGWVLDARLVASKASLVAVEAWAAAGGAGSGCGA
eukprot:jgi/Tetstr1/425094/TSEL_015558.t1